MPADPRSLLVVDTRELDRRPGSTRHLHRTVDAPAGLDVPSAQVAVGSPLVLDVTVDSIVDGLWISGTAGVTVTAECVRCLDEVSSQLSAELAALYVNPAVEPERGRDGTRDRGADRRSDRAGDRRSDRAGDRRTDRAGDRHTAGRVGLEPDDDSDGDTVFALDGDLLDLEQVVRDAVVLALPLRPLCREDCPGLRLDGSRADPDEDGGPVDPRWAALAALSGDGASSSVDGAPGSVDGAPGSVDGAPVSDGAVPGSPRT